jgi:prepilin-type N-terminal cleavage/methylation domain-containing protein
MKQNNMSALRRQGFQPGFTLIELLIFLAIFSMVTVVMIPVLYTTIESRMRQQTIELVEDNANQVLQQIERRIRNAERIIAPAMGESGSVLVLQMSSGSINPTIIGVQTGALVVIEKDIVRKLTSTQVAVLNFVVRNTSPAASTPSVFSSFQISRTIHLNPPHTYTRFYENAAALHPTDSPTGDCGCSSASCSDNVLTWYVCFGGSCSERQDNMVCP